MRWIVLIGLLIGLLIGWGLAFPIPADAERPAPQSRELRVAGAREWEPPTPPISEASADIDVSTGYDEEDSYFEEEYEDEVEAEVEVEARPVIEEIRGGSRGPYVEPEVKEIRDRTRPRYTNRKVIIYTTSWCGYCRKAIAMLDASGVPYINKDVEKDRGARKEQLRKSGGSKGVPLIDVGGKILRGYNPDSLKAALARLQ